MITRNIYMITKSYGKEKEELRFFASGWLNTQK